MNSHLVISQTAFIDIQKHANTIIRKCKLDNCMDKHIINDNCIDAKTRNIQKNQESIGEIDNKLKELDLIICESQDIIGRHVWKQN